MSNTDWFNSQKNSERVLSRISEREVAQRQRVFDADEIFAKLSERVIGQDRLVRRVASTVARRAGRPRQGKPIFSVLLSGPSGTGKTELAKALGYALWGDENRYCYRLDCGNLGRSEHDLAAVIGSPSVYQGSSHGSLVEYLQTVGKGVLLFDEFEKAVPDMQAPLAKVMLALLDEGRVQSRYDNGIVHADQCVIVLTSNLKQTELAELPKKFAEDEEKLEEAVKSTLRDSLAPEFLARLDLVTTVDPLSTEAKTRILALSVNKLAAQYKLRIVSVDDGMFDLLIDAAHQWGQKTTRDLLRWIEKELSDPFYDAEQEGFKEVAIEVRDGKIKVREAR